MTRPVCSFTLWWARIGLLQTSTHPVLVLTSTDPALDLLQLRAVVLTFALLRESPYVLFSWIGFTLVQPTSLAPRWGTRTASDIRAESSYGSDFSCSLLMARTCS